MMKPMLLKDFLFRERFSELTDEHITEACVVINAQFSGVSNLWSFLPPSEAEEKRKLCLNYLIGWYLVDTYPGMVNGAQSTGGMPIQRKKVGSVLIQYKETVRQGSGVLDALTTNVYGIRALTMIQSAPENYMIYA